MTEIPSIGGDGTARLGTDVFISYAREDRPFVGRLHDVLANQGLQAWVDWEGIPASAKWMVEVRAAIDQADAFCFVISPNSVESSVCREEAAHAAAGGKRIVPVLCHEVDEGLVPEIVAAHNWIDFTDQASFDEAFATLARTIAIDPEYVREHTKLLVRAKEWDAANRDRSKLLRGAELDEAEVWLADAEDKDPRPIPAQSAYVLASRRAASRRQRAGVVAVVCVLVLSLVLSGLAIVQRNAARRAQVDAESRALAASSLLQAEQDPELSLILAVEAAETAKTDAAYDALRRSIGVANLAETVTEPITPNALALSRDGSVLAVAGNVGSGRPSISFRSVEGFDVGTGRNVQLDGAGRGLVGDVALSDDGSQAAVSDGDGSVWLVDLVEGSVLHHGGFQAAPDWSALAFSASGRDLFVAGQHGLIGVDVATWRAATIAKDEIGSPYRADMQLTPDGRYALLAASDGVHVFDLTNAGHDRVLGRGHTVTSLSVNPSGSMVAAGLGSYTLVWSTSDWRPAGTFGHLAPGLNSDIVALSTDGTSVYIGDISGRGSLWDVQSGERVTDFVGHEGGIVGAAFSRDGDALYTSSEDSTTRIWRVTGREPEAAISGDSLIGVNRDASVMATQDSQGANRDVVVFRDGQGEPLSSVDVNTKRSNAGPCVGSSFADVGSFTGQAPLSIPISDDGSLAVVPSSEGPCLLLLDPMTGAYVGLLDLGQVTGQPVSSVSAWPTGDGSSLLAKVDTAGGATELWKVDVANGEGIWHMRYPTDDTFFVVGDVSPSGRTAAIADESSLSRVDMAGGTVVCRAVFGRSHSQTADVAVGVDGQVAVASASGVRLFDGSCRDVTPGALASDGRGYMSVAYSGDGAYLAALAGDDVALRFWDVDTGSLVYEVPSPNWFLAFEGEGDNVVAGYSVSGIRRYPCEPCSPFDDLLELARSRVTRELTPLEQETYLGERQT